MATKQPDLTADPRVQELAACVLHALNNSKNCLLMVGDDFTKTTTLHEWYRSALIGAGFKLKDGPGAKKKAAKTAD